MGLVIAFLALLLSVFGYETDKITLSNGVNVNNIDRAVYVYPEGYIVQFDFADPGEYVVIYDNFDQTAIEISSNGFAHIDF